MTILEKQGPSTAPYAGDNTKGEGDHMKANEYGNEKYDYGSVQSEMPPSYADSVPSGPSSSRGRPVGPLPTNYTDISHTNGKVTGHWNVDTNLQIPSSLLKPLPSDQTTRPNLCLHTRNGSIKATVSLVSGSAQRASLEFGSWNGKVSVSVISRINSQPCKIKATTLNGTVSISLPFDFCGVLKCRASNGSIIFSEDMQSNTSIFSDEISFIGDWQASGFTDFAQWQGDEVEAETINGKIHFTYAESPEENHDTHSSTRGAKLRKGGGFFSRLMSDSK